MSEESTIAAARQVAQELGLEGDAGVIKILARTVETIAPGVSPGFLRWNARFPTSDPGKGKVRPTPIGIEVDTKAARK
jgi:hypothetical protein